MGSCTAHVGFTLPFAGIRFRGRYWGQSGHGLLRRTCLLLTQSGHRSAPEADPFPNASVDWYR